MPIEIYARIEDGDLLITLRHGTVFQTTIAYEQLPETGWQWDLFKPCYRPELIKTLKQELTNQEVTAILMGQHYLISSKEYTLDDVAEAAVYRW